MGKNITKETIKSVTGEYLEYYLKPDDVHWEECKEELLKEHDIVFTDGCRYPIKIIWRRDPKEGDDTPLFAFGHIVFYDDDIFFKLNENGTYKNTFDSGFAGYMLETLREAIEYSWE